MSNYNNINEKYEQKGQVDYLPTVSHPDPTEALDVGSPTSVAHNGVLLSSENYQPFDQQLNKSEFEKNKIQTTCNKIGPYRTENESKVNTYRKEQALDYESALEVEDLEIEKLTKLVAQARILEKKATLKRN